jgi:hypothetical protein
MLTLAWQLIAIFGCCLGLGLCVRFLLPEALSPLGKTVFTFAIGLFLLVLLPQNLVYLGVPVRLSAWFALGLAAFQFYRCRGEFRDWLRIFCTNADLKALSIVILFTAVFHSAVPVQQGLGVYYGKAGLDFYPYTLLAQYLRDESYKTAPSQFGLRPSALLVTKNIHERIGQSIIQAEVSVFSQTNAQSGFAATVVLFLTALAICSYGILRQMGVPCFTAVTGASLPAIFQSITRLTIDAYLSQTATLFVFVFLTHLLLQRDLKARSFALFFSLGLAYLISAYSELLPFGCAALLLGIAFARQDTLQTKLRTLLGAILLVALVNPFYINNLISFLEQQYLTAAQSQPMMNNLIPGVLTLRGWSEALFGVMPSRIAPLFEICAVAFAFLAIPGLMFLKKFQKPAFLSFLLPFIASALYLTTKTPLPVYPLTKLIFSFLPLISVLAFAAIARFVLPGQVRWTTRFRAALLLFLVALAARGSMQAYQKTWSGNDLIESKSIKDQDFLEVCRQLEGVKNKKLLIFETDRSLFLWLCYHARNNDVFTILDPGRILIGSGSLKLAFCEIPKLQDVDLVVMRNQIIDAKSGQDFYLALIDPSRGEQRENGTNFYWVSPPKTKVCFLGSRPVLADLRIQLSPGSDAKVLPVPVSIRQGQDDVFNGEIYRPTGASVRLRIPQGISEIEVGASGLAAAREPNDPFQCMVRLDTLEVTGTKLLPAGYTPRLSEQINPLAPKLE